MDGSDRITDFNTSEDHLVLNDGLKPTNTERVILTTIGNDMVITFDHFVGIDQTITLEGVTGFTNTQAAVGAGWLVFA